MVSPKFACYHVEVVRNYIQFRFPVAERLHEESRFLFCCR